MVQVDVFWSYGLGAGLALAAAPKLKKEKDPWVNPYFILTLLWIAIFFAPSGMYLLWRYPYWETMFLAKNQDGIPGWLVVLFAVTNITQGILGYYVTYRLLRKDKDGWAKLQTVWSHGAMIFILVFGWDGSGWRRFTYAGTGEEWQAGIVHTWTEFFSSSVFYSLLVLGLFLVPTYSYMAWWLRSSKARQAF